MNTFWKDRKVLITGGTGFLGKHLSDALLREGAILDIFDFRRPKLETEGINFYEGDIRDKNKIFALCCNTDTIFHLAAMPSIARGKLDEYFQINAVGTANLLEAAFEHKVRKVVHVSSSTVYGVPKEFPLKETSPVSAIGKYGRSKLEAENSCCEFINKGLNISIIRPRVIIGPGRAGIFSILFERIRNHKPVYIIGRGDNLFQFTNVLDMASACIKAAEYPSPGLFNIGSEIVLPVAEELATLVGHAKSRSRIVSLPVGLAKISLRALSFLGLSPLVNEQFIIADKNFKLDTLHAHEKLGWSPLYSNLDSLIQAYDWYLEHREENKRQYKNIFGVLGKFRHSRMGEFQKA